MSQLSIQMATDAETTSRQARLVSSHSEQINKSFQSVSSSIEQVSASIREISGNVRSVIDMTTQSTGDVVMLRSERVGDALQEIFGQQARSKIIRIDGGAGNVEEAEIAIHKMLKTFSDAKRIAFTGINDQMVQGAMKALQPAGRWDAANMIAVPLGLDSLGRQLLHDGPADVGVAFFPERYGEVVIPAALTLLAGEAVPNTMYAPNAILTRGILAHYYP